MYKGERNEEGEPHGRGCYYWADGRRYDGNFRYGVFEGFGVQQWKKPHKRKGARYEGEFLGGQRNGEGVHVEPDRTIITEDGPILVQRSLRYEGQWVGDSEHGEGVVEYGDGVRFEGAWVCGKKHGMGREAYPDGSSYEGDWVEGERHGQGRMTWPDGTYYSGGWVEDRRTEAGVYVNVDGTSVTPPTPMRDFEYKGQRDHMGQPHGKGEATFPDGSSYDGEWRNGIKHGRGVHATSTGKYNGGWRMGVHHGHGVYKSAERTSYDGQWVNGVKHGNMTITHADGRKYQLVIEDPSVDLEAFPTATRVEDL
jgi:hypothetical protein